MTIISIRSGFGEVKVLCIGEYTVQTFVTSVFPGDVVNKLDKLGHFYFRSQVIVAFPLGLDPVVSLSGEHRLFPGDPLCMHKGHRK